MSDHWACRHLLLHGLPAVALFAQACMWVMRGTLFLSALLFMTFVSA